MSRSSSGIQWSPLSAAHLLNRAGFGATPEQIEEWYQLGHVAAVNKITDGSDDHHSSLDWHVARDFQKIESSLAELGDAERRRQLKLTRRHLRGTFWPLVSWWIHRMAESGNPFREKLTLFWHDHFATSMFKISHAYLMWRQNQTLRENAYGSFRRLVQLISRDPAMMLWLDTATSTKRRPNENFGRELLELFTLGEGHYSERDIQEAARAFTGYKVNFNTEEFAFKSSDFDEGEKTVLGTAGRLDGDAVIDICLRQPQCAHFICRKLWVYYAGTEPAADLLERLSDTFRRTDYQIRPVLTEIFLSPCFFSPEIVRHQIKSPVQWLIAIARQLKLHLPKDGLHLGSPLRQMGQLPFMPPDVDGWPHGTDWITTAQLLFRYAFAKHLIAQGPLRLQDLGVLGTALNRREYNAKKSPPLDVAKIVSSADRGAPESLVNALAWRLFNTTDGIDLSPFLQFAARLTYPATDDAVIELVYLMTSTPDYQLI